MLIVYSLFPHSFTVFLSNNNARIACLHFLMKAGRFLLSVFHRNATHTGSCAVVAFCTCYLPTILMILKKVNQQVTYEGVESLITDHHNSGIINICDRFASCYLLSNLCDLKQSLEYISHNNFFTMKLLESIGTLSPAPRVQREWVFPAFS